MHGEQQLCKTKAPRPIYRTKGLVVPPEFAHALRTPQAILTGWTARPLPAGDSGNASLIAPRCLAPPGNSLGRTYDRPWFPSLSLLLIQLLCAILA
jgi:hypothetical protein